MTLTDSNMLKTFPEGNEVCAALKSLHLGHNQLQDLDLTAFSPKLQRLDLDGNKLACTSGLTQLKYLEKVSMRSQMPASGTCNLQPLLEARMSELNTLCLSENHIPELSMPHDWFSLRSLELASCGLHNLPDDFGQSVPNLRCLNLNFNAIKDVRPLLNIKALTTLHVAGNRLARLRKSTAVLSKLRKLETLDLRDNPFSIGFYPKAVERRLVQTVLELPDEEQQGSKEEDGLQFLLPSTDKDTDSQYFARLDEGTKLRRRVYEMLLANNCTELGELDGMAFVRKDVLVKDAIWERLLLLGVLKKSGKVVEGEGYTP